MNMIIDSFIPTREENYPLLSESEANRLVQLFRDNIQVAFEIEFEVVGSRTWQIADGIRDALGRERSPHNGLLIYDIKGDGSLSNGLELTICGQPTKASETENLFNIVDRATSEIIRRTNGGHIYRTCGGHMHIMLAHNGNQHMCEEVIPRIVMANFYQLIRRFAPELTWITSTMKTNGITRSFDYREYSSFMSSSPKRQGIRRIANSLGRYVYFNMNRTMWQDRDIKVFHVELRFPDGNLSSYALTAYANLFSALMIEAVKYSQFGLISTGAKEYWERTKQLMQLFERQKRMVFTTKIKDEIKQRSEKLLEIAEEELENIDSGKSLAVLKSLLDKPIAYRHRSGKNWSDINDELEDVAIFARLQRIIETGKVTNTSGPVEWLQLVSNLLNSDTDNVRNLLKKNYNDELLRYSKTVGAFVPFTTNEDIKLSEAI